MRKFTVHVHDFSIGQEEITTFILRNARYFTWSGKPLDAILHEEDDDGGYEIASKLTGVLANELLWLTMCENMKSVPSEYHSGFYRLVDQYMIAADGGPFPAADVVPFFRVLLTTLAEWYFNVNEWLLVEFELQGRRLKVSVGEDLRHLVFRKEHGTGSWTGPYYTPDGAQYDFGTD